MVAETLGLELLAAMGLYLSGIFIHELGHLKELRKHFPAANITWDGKEFIVGKEWMYQNLKKEDYQSVFFWGVMIGYAPIAMGFLIINEWVMLVTTIMYFYGSYNDIIALWKRKHESDSL